MPTFAITHAQRLDDYVVVQTLEGTEIGTGQGITVASVATGINGTYTVEAVPTHLFMGVDEQGDPVYDAEIILPNQLLVYCPGDDLDRYAVIPHGTLTWAPTCTWIAASAVIAWLGIESATANDTAFITTCTAAANAFAYRRRREAGYFDSLSTSPGGDVTLGTTMYAAVLYRERGSVDSFASFEGMGGPMPIGSTGQINRLLGVNRSQVA